MEMTYWAANDGDKLAKSCLSYIENTFKRHPMMPLWQRAYSAYYANALRGDADSALNFLGSKGEVIQTSMNEARSTTRQVVSIVTKNRLAFEPSTQSSEAYDLDDAKIAKGLGEWIVTDEKLDLKQSRLAENVALFGGAFLGCLWRPDCGPIVTDESTGKRVRAGKAEVFALPMCSVWFDYRKSDWSEVEWVVFKVRRNRYSLMQLHATKQPKDGEDPGEAEAQNLLLWDALEKAPCARDDDFEWMKADDAQHGTDVGTSDEFGSETIYLYYFVHAPCAALPEGRILTFLRSGEVVTDDETNPYEELMLEPCIPETFQNETLWGYARILDVLPAQESYDTVWSSVVTNLSALGIQAVQAPEGTNINHSQINGLRFMTYKNSIPGQPAGKIEPLMLCQQAPDAYKCLEALRNTEVELSGLNGALRGTPPPGVDAGIAIATLSANSLEFLQDFTKSIVNCLNGTMTRAVKVYAKFALVPQSIPISNDQNKEQILQFIGDKLKRVRRMTMQMTNPLFLTMAGKIMISKELLGAGILKSKGEYLNMLETGNYEQLTDDSLDETRLINAENDLLRKGEMPAALALDKHADHIISHKRVVENPALRALANKYRPPMPQAPGMDLVAGAAQQMALAQTNTDEVTKAYMIVKSTLDHVEEHRKLGETTSPYLLAIVETGMAPAPQPMPELPPAQPQGAA